MKKSKKQKIAKQRHLIEKSRAKYRRILRRYYDPGYWCRPFVLPNAFEDVAAELMTLSVKHLQQLLNDLNSNVSIGWGVNNDKRLRLLIESSILERTLLK